MIKDLLIVNWALLIRCGLNISDKVWCVFSASKKDLCSFLSCFIVYMEVFRIIAQNYQLHSLYALWLLLAVSDTPPKSVDDSNGWELCQLWCVWVVWWQGSWWCSWYCFEDDTFNSCCSYIVIQEGMPYPYFHCQFAIIPSWRFSHCTIATSLSQLSISSFFFSFTFCYLKSFLSWDMVPTRVWSNWKSKATESWLPKDSMLMS